MRVIGFILGFLLILGLVRLSYTVNWDFSHWMPARQKPASTSLQPSASLMPPPSEENADSLADTVDSGNKEVQPIDIDLSSALTASKESNQSAAPQQPVAETKSSLSLEVVRQTHSPVSPEAHAEARVSQAPIRQSLEDKKWQSFWKPFSTPGSAQGFARSITEKTGLEVKVIRVKAGQYEVAFAYSDAEDRVADTRLIERELGLRLEITRKRP